MKTFQKLFFYWVLIVFSIAANANSSNLSASIKDNEFFKWWFVPSNVNPLQKQTGYVNTFLILNPEVNDINLVDSHTIQARLPSKKQTFRMLLSVSFLGQEKNQVVVFMLDSKFKHIIDFVEILNVVEKADPNRLYMFTALWRDVNVPSGGVHFVVLHKHGKTIMPIGTFYFPEL